MLKEAEVIEYIQKLAADIQQNSTLASGARIQRPSVVQKNRQRSAVIVKGSPKYIDNNPLANKFYNNLADLVRKQGYTVTFDKGEDMTVPSKADVWLGHSRGASRLKYAPKDTKTIPIGVPNGINHPKDRAMFPGQVPDVFHYILSNQMKEAIKKVLV